MLIRKIDYIYILAKIKMNMVVIIGVVPKCIQERQVKFFFLIKINDNFQKINSRILNNF